MRATLLGLTLIYLSGCTDPADMLETKRKTTATPPGIAPVGDMAGVEPAGKPKPKPAGNGAEVKAKQPATAPPTTHPPQGGQKKSSIIGKMTAKVVDMQKAMKENPNLVIVENKVAGSDPLTVAASAYVSATSRASTANFKHQLDIIKATNGRYPTYAEYTKLAGQLRIEFAMLPPYQMYGYDEKAGGVVILEDKAEKARRYKAAGIPLEK